MRKRISPATVIASVALFFSLGGVGIAASGYRITSIWQIAPKVRHALRGERGPRGPQGQPGAPGPQGPATQAAAAADTPRLGVSLTCAAAIVYAGFGTSPQPITLTWTDNGAPIKTQIVLTGIAETSNNSVQVLAATPPPVSAGDTLGLVASWTYAGGGQVGPYTTVDYC